MTKSAPDAIITAMRLPLLLACLALPVTLAAQADSARGLQTTAVNAHQLRPGDVLRIRVWGQDTFSGEFQVDERGVIEYPLLGEIQTAGSTVAELRDRIRQGVSQLFRDPFVTVTPLFRMAVLGNVSRPGLYIVDPTMTTFDAVALAGGTAGAGSLGHVRLLRGGERIELDFEEQALAGRTLSEIGVRSGDQIVVGRPWLTLSELGLILSIAQIAISTAILIRTF